MILHHLNQKWSGGGSPEHPSPQCDITYTFYKAKTLISNVFCLEKIPRDVSPFSFLSFFFFFACQIFFGRLDPPTKSPRYAPDYD